MYVDVKNLKPTRSNFYITVFLAFSLSAAIYFYPEEKDDVVLSYLAFMGSFLYCSIGLFIIFGGRVRDSAFGLSYCPHCGKNGWNIKEKLKITPNDKTNLGRCLFCNKKGKIPFKDSFIFILIILSWLPVLGISGSLIVATLIFYVSVIAYLFFLGWYVQIEK
jgi:hypothetical protein